MTTIMSNRLFQILLTALVAVAGTFGIRIPKKNSDCPHTADAAESMSCNGVVDPEGSSTGVQWDLTPCEQPVLPKPQPESTRDSDVGSPSENKSNERHGSLKLHSDMTYADAKLQGLPDHVTEEAFNYARSLAGTLRVCGMEEPLVDVSEGNGLA